MMEIKFVVLIILSLTIAFAIAFKITFGRMSKEIESMKNIIRGSHRLVLSIVKQHDGEIRIPKYAFDDVTDDEVVSYHVDGITFEHVLTVKKLTEEELGDN